MIEAVGCTNCHHTKYMPTSFDSEGCFDFVECPYCGNDKDFKNKMGWTPKVRVESTARKLLREMKRILWG